MENNRGTTKLPVAHLRELFLRRIFFYHKFFIKFSLNLQINEIQSKIKTNTGKHLKKKINFINFLEI